MNYLRKTVESDVLNSIFDLPPALRNTWVQVIILPAEPEAKKARRTFDFVDSPPLPDSFFDQLPEEELDAWGL